MEDIGFSDALDACESSTLFALYYSRQIYGAIFRLRAESSYKNAEDSLNGLLDKYPLTDLRAMINDYFIKNDIKSTFAELGKKINESKQMTLLTYSMKMDIVLFLQTQLYMEKIMYPKKNDSKENPIRLEADKISKNYPELFGEQSTTCWNYMNAWTCRNDLPVVLLPVLLTIASYSYERNDKPIRNRIYTKRIFTADLSLKKYSEMSERLLRFSDILRRDNAAEPLFDYHYGLILNMSLLNMLSGHYENTALYCRFTYRKNPEGAKSKSIDKYMPESFMDHEILSRKLFFTQLALLGLFSDWKDSNFIKIINKYVFTNDSDLLRLDIAFFELLRESVAGLCGIIERYVDIACMTLSKRIFDSTDETQKEDILTHPPFLTKKNITELYPFRFFRGDYPEHFDTSRKTTVRKLNNDFKFPYSQNVAEKYWDHSLSDSSMTINLK